MTCETCIKTYAIMGKAPDCANCPCVELENENSRLRAVIADKDELLHRAAVLDTGRRNRISDLEKRLAAVRPAVMADLERDIAEHGELWKELAKR